MYQWPSQIFHDFVDGAECWHCVVDCHQCRNGSLMDYTQHNAQVFILYREYNTSSISDVLGSVSVSQWPDGLKADLHKVLPILKPDWHESLLACC